MRSQRRIEASRINLLQLIAGTNSVYALAKEHKIKTAFGTDLLFSSTIAERQGLMLTHLTRWYDNADTLKMATSVNAELLAMSGPGNPYQGKLVGHRGWCACRSASDRRQPDR